MTNVTAHGLDTDVVDAAAMRSGANAARAVRGDLAALIDGVTAVGGDNRKVELVANLVQQISDADFSVRTWERYTPQALATRMLHSVPDVTTGKNMWDEAIGPFFDTTRLRLWKGVTRQRLDTLRKSDRLIALTSSDNRLLYPEFQFGPAGELLPHLDEVLPALRRSYNDWDAALWLNTPSDDWGGKTAAQVLHEGNEEAYRRILAEARADAASLAR